MVGGIWTQVQETITSPHTEPGAVFVSQAILVFGIAALVFTALHTKRPLLWWVGSVVHLIAGAILPFTADLVSFFIAWELVTIGAALMLVGEPQGRTLLKWYLPWQLFAAAMLLSAFALEYAETGSYHIPVEGLRAGLIPLGLALAIKASVMPAHIWLIKTYTEVRPTTAVVLSAVATKVGVFGVYRLMPGHISLEIAGAILALLAVLYALRQDRLRPFLAFHMISQIGFMIAGTGSVSRMAQLGGLYHLGNNIVYKGLLFMVVAMLVPISRTPHIYTLRAAGRRSIALTLTACAAALSISGVPPLSGYVSKSILQNSLESPAAAALLTVAGIGTAISFTKFLWHGFLKPGSLPTSDRPKEIDVNSREPLRESRSARTAVQTIAGAVALLTLGMGLAPQFFLPALPPDTGIDVSSLILGQISPATGGLIFFLLYDPLLRVLQIALPDSQRSIAGVRWCVTCSLDILQRQHTGSIQRYLGWTVTGALIIWIAVILMGSPS